MFGMNLHSFLSAIFLFSAIPSLMKSPDKHRKIIRAATKVFAKKGFFNARISDIAKEAKVADGTIYLYFNNKFDILLSVFNQETEKLFEQVRQMLKNEDDPRDMLGVFIGTHLEEMKKNRYLAEVIHTELRQTSKPIREYRKTAFNEYLNIITCIIDKGQQQGIFRPDVNPEIVKQMLFGALDEVTRLWHQGGETAPALDEVRQQITDIFTLGLAIPGTADSSSSAQADADERLD